jgi:hypothetical protein
MKNTNPNGGKNMKTRSIITVAMVLLVLVGFVSQLNAAAAQTVTQTAYTVAEGMYMLDLAVTTDTTGAMSNYETENINGIIYMVETSPGSTAPTNLYDLTLLNDNSIDLMGGNLADRSDTLTQRASPLRYQAQPVKGKLTLTLAHNSVHNGQFNVRIWFFK